MENTELLRLFRDVMDKQSDTFSGMTREITKLVERQQTACGELKVVSNTLQKIEFNLNDGLHTKIKDDLYTITTECREANKLDWKACLNKHYLKITLSFAIGFVILVLAKIFGV